MDGKQETALRDEIEQLRQELHRLLSDHATELTSARTCALSARLDLLIARYMSESMKSEAAGN